MPRAAHTLKVAGCSKMRQSRQIDRTSNNFTNASASAGNSERIAKDGTQHPLHGLQLWVALPQALEDSEPTFDHHPATTLPELAERGRTIRVLAGTAYGATSTMKTVSPMFYGER